MIKSKTRFLQFTESISAINCMYLGVSVIRAKNAFLKGLKVADSFPSTPEVQSIGGHEWRMIEDSHEPVLKWNNIDFSSDFRNKKKQGAQINHQNFSKLGNHYPPPPPPMPPKMMSNVHIQGEHY